MHCSCTLVYHQDSAADTPPPQCRLLPNTSPLKFQLEMDKDQKLVRSSRASLKPSGGFSAVSDSISSHRCLIGASSGLPMGKSLRFSNLHRVRDAAGPSRLRRSDALADAIE